VATRCLATSRSFRLVCCDAVLSSSKAASAGTRCSAVACSFRNGAAAELRAVPAGARAVAPLLRPAHGRPLFGDRPVGVVSSAAYGPRWDAWQAQWAAISRRSVHGRTGDRFHDIHLRHPDRVLDAVR
jgi:hypothetical protein